MLNGLKNQADMMKIEKWEEIEEMIEDSKNLILYIECLKDILIDMKEIIVIRIENKEEESKLFNII